MKKFVLAAIFTIVPSIGFGESSKIDLLWKARGLQATEKIEKIRKSLNGKKSYPKKTECELKLEEYYSGFADLEKAKLLHETSKGSDIYNIVFVDQSQESGSGLTMVRVVYDTKQSIAPDAIGVVALATSWSFTIFAPYPDVVALRGGGCAFMFPMKDPLAGSSAPM